MVWNKEIIYKHSSLNFVLEYAIGYVQRNKVLLELNRTHRLPVYVDYINILGKNQYHKEKHDVRRRLNSVYKYTQTQPSSYVSSSERRTISLYKGTQKIFWICGRVQTFGKDGNKQKFHYQRN
jgi:hypothetical protein